MRSQRLTHEKPADHNTHKMIDLHINSIEMKIVMNEVIFDQMYCAPAMNEYLD